MPVGESQIVLAPTAEIDQLRGFRALEPLLTQVADPAQLLGAPLAAAGYLPGVPLDIQNDWILLPLPTGGATVRWPGFRLRRIRRRRQDLPQVHHHHAAGGHGRTHGGGRRPRRRRTGEGSRPCASDFRLRIHWNPLLLTSPQRRRCGGEKTKGRPNAASEALKVEMGEQIAGSIWPPETAVV